MVKQPQKYNQLKASFHINIKYTKKRINNLEFYDFSEKGDLPWILKATSK